MEKMTFHTPTELVWLTEDKMRALFEDAEGSLEGKYVVVILVGKPVNHSYYFDHCDSHCDAFDRALAMHLVAGREISNKMMIIVHGYQNSKINSVVFRLVRPHAE